MSIKKNKVVLIGDSSVGKTSIINRLKNLPFNDEEHVTIGAAFCTYIVNIQGQEVILNIWDTAGQEKYGFFLPMFLREAKVALICFDSDYLGQIIKYTELVEDFNKDIKIILVATKMDLRGIVIDLPIQNYAFENEFDTCRTSAKENTGIKELFRSVATYMLVRDIPKIEEDNILLEDENKDKDCCHL